MKELSKEEVQWRVTEICREIFTLDEYQRKQIISILIASTLNDQSNKDAKMIYDKIINLLDD